MTYVRHTCPCLKKWCYKDNLASSLQMNAIFILISYQFDRTVFERPLLYIRDALAAERERVKELTDGLGAMYVYEAVGSDETFWQTTELVRDGGTVTLLGLMAHDNTPMPMASVVMHGIKFVPIIRYSNLFEEALCLLEYKRSEILPALSHTFDFAHSQEAFQKVVHDKKDVIKVVIKL